MPKDMRSFISELEENYPEEIIRVTKGPLDPAKGECIALLYHLMKCGKRPMAVFDNVTSLRGQRWGGSIAFQLAGTWSKVGIGYGLGTKNMGLLEIQSETEIRTRKRIPPVVVNAPEAPIKDVVRSNKEINFYDLPAYRAAEKDHRPGNLAGILIIRDPDSLRYNLSWHMNHIIDAETSAVTLARTDAHAWQIILKYQQRGQDLVPVAQVFGHHVLLGLAAAVRCGLDVDEYDFAGAILGEPLRLVPSKSWGEELLIPADAEVVIEGYISATQWLRHDVWSDTQRYYIPERESPAFKVGAVNMREKPILEHCWVGQYVYTDLATCSFITNMLRSRFPGVKAVNYVAQSVLIVQFKPDHPGDVRRLASLAHGYGALIKHVIVVDEDVDPFDADLVLWSIGTRVDATQRVQVVDGLKPMSLDPSAKHGNPIGGLIIDSTKPIGEAFPEVGYPAKDVLDRVHVKEYLPQEKLDQLVLGKSTRPWARI